ncbi:hypothetical protein [Nonomuraea sp. NPDC049784]|uniref:hypothetical protein n=1 Tax=Nonomuraea sp. NPDC049784 TaxID=3154361 RepID=UPI003402D981
MTSSIAITTSNGDKARTSPPAMLAEFQFSTTCRHSWISRRNSSPMMRPYLRLLRGAG